MWVRLELSEKRGTTNEGYVREQCGRLNGGLVHYNVPYTVFGTMLVLRANRRNGTPLSYRRINLRTHVQSLTFGTRRGSDMTSSFNCLHVIVDR